jgi:fumarate hydratase class I
MLDSLDLTAQILELIRLASTDLPLSVVDKIKQALSSEEPGSPAYIALEIILRNVQIARVNSTPICQDTGTLLFNIQFPKRYSISEIEGQIALAVLEAEELNYLRPPANDEWDDPIDSRNHGHHQSIDLHFEEREDTNFEIDLVLKGGGCENMSAQFSLPDMSIKAERDLEGVRKAALQSLFIAQGKGCSPGFLGICIGGDRLKGFESAKAIFHKIISEVSLQPGLAKLEEQITAEANTLGIGPMGFGGKSTLLHTKITTEPRLPASFFVTISYMCWAFRHKKLRIDNGICSIE